MKDIDSSARSRLIKVAAWVFPIMSFFGYFVGLRMFGKPVTGLAIGAAVGAIATFITWMIIEGLGSSGVNLLYGKRRPVYTEYEKYEGELHQARHQKTLKNYPKALGLVSAILKDSPDLPEALYLKAQILVEGYGKGKEAKYLLEKILAVLPERGETYHRWAQSLLDKIDSEQDR
jgi:tetratricopeptide (TPR) repeat protein